MPTLGSGPKATGKLNTKNDSILATTNRIDVSVCYGHYSNLIRAYS